MKKMNRSDVMKVLRWAGFLVLCVGLSGQTCLEERCVELVVAATITAPFEARGSENVHHDTEVVDLIDNADIRQALADNGFEDMVVGYVESAFYRVTKQDAGAPDRRVSGSIRMVAEPDTVDLILYEEIDVNDPALANWVPAPLEQPGVDYINAQLLNYFTAIFIHGIPDPPHPEVTFVCDGDSDPPDVPTNFDWEVRIKLILVGENCLEVVDPI